MADEVDIVTLFGNAGDPEEWIVATGTALAKGTVMQISSSPQTATAATADGNKIAGVTAVEKTATDGVVSMALITNALLDVTATTSSGSMVLGGTVKITGANTVAPADDSGIANAREVLGTAYETVSAGNRGVVRMNLR